MKLDELKPETLAALETCEWAETKKAVTEAIETARGKIHIGMWCAAELYWMVYPNKTFDLMKYYKLFK